MIEGIGIDIVEIDRMEQTIRSWGDKFYEKIFTEREIAYANSKKFPVQHLAGRFAVKEAVAKAISTGWSEGFKWKDVEVENDLRGKPSVILHGRLKTLLKDSSVLISLSHSQTMVVAMAIIQTEKK